MTDNEIVQNTVKSSDGTIIAYATIGRGPGIIIVPGALEVADEFYNLANKLAGSFTVHIIERRGRGRSGAQGDDYNITKECEDVQAVQAKTEASYLIGHSYGGLIALECARTSAVFSKLAAYEPALSIEGSIPSGWMPHYREQLAQNKRFDAFTDFTLAIGPERARTLPRPIYKIILRFVVGASHLPQILGLLPESLREHEEVARMDGAYRSFADVRVPVLIMYGGLSKKSGLAWVEPSMQRLAQVLPTSKTHVFPGFDHFGPTGKDAEEVARTIEEYFLKH